MMRGIGVSISEAIDWTQDQLVTTRPLAERTLFALLAERRVTETEHGFVLTEDANEEDVKNQHRRLQTTRNHRPSSGLKHTRRLKLRQETRVMPKDTPNMDIDDAVS